MSLRRAEREDVSVQQERLKEACTELGRALKELARAADEARPRDAHFDDVRAAFARFDRAEEGRDIATLDLATASGEHA